MNKRILSLVLVLVMILGSISTVFATPPEDDVKVALLAAEEAISELPELEQTRLYHKDKIEAARELVEIALALDVNVSIKGLNKLLAAEAKMVNYLIGQVREHDPVSYEYITKFKIAKEAYDELNDDARNLVSTSNANKLVRIERKIEAAKAEIQEKLLDLKNDLKDSLIYGEPTYNVEAKNKVTDKLVELGLNVRDFKITIDPFDSNGNKRVQIFHNEFDVAIGFYFKKAMGEATIKSLIDPEQVTVKIGAIVEMPETVIANMSDGSTKEVNVIWNPEQIDTATEGIKEAIGEVEGFEGNTIFKVTVEDIQAKLVQLKNDLQNNPIYGKPSYNVESRKKVTDKLVELGLNPKDFKITVDPFDVNGNKRVQIFHNKSDAAIGFYFKKAVAEIIIESLINPDPVTVRVGVKVEMPATVIANMSDGSTKEVKVIWNPEQIDTATKGIKAAIGEVEGFEGTVTFTVTVEVVKMGNLHIRLLKDRSDRIDFKLIKESFYIKNKATGEEFKEGTTPWNFAENYKMKVPVGEYTIHYELPDKISTKKIELGGAYNETDYDPDTNPLVIEDLGKNNKNMKIIIKADVLIKEIKEMEILILPKDITYEEFWAAKPTTAVIVDENGDEHEVEVRLNINKFNFETGREKGTIKIETDSFELPLYVSNIEPAMRLRAWLTIVFEDPEPEVYNFSASLDKSEYDIDDEITLSGEVLELGDGLKGINITYKLEKDSEIILISMTNTDNAGRFNEIFQVPEELEAGTYLLTVKANSPVDKFIELKLVITK